MTDTTNRLVPAAQQTLCVVDYVWRPTARRQHNHARYRSLELWGHPRSDTLASEEIRTPAGYTVEHAIRLASLGQREQLAEDAKYGYDKCCCVGAVG